MAVKRNVTVAIDAALLKRARSLAVRRGSSVSAFLEETLRGLVSRELGYSSAERIARELLQEGLPLGGAIYRARKSLHNRSRLR